MATPHPFSTDPLLARFSFQIFPLNVIAGWKMHWKYTYKHAVAGYCEAHTLTLQKTFQEPKKKCSSALFANYDFQTKYEPSSKKPPSLQTQN